MGESREKFASVAIPHSTSVPPCQDACPIHQNVREYIAFIAQGELNQAVEVIKKTNPLSSVCATICAHPCETECRRGQVDQPLAIRGLKRFALEHGSAGQALAPAEYKEHKIAIIGSGPAGLTAAHDLVQMGYRVTVFEREESLGGALAVIPEYRLPTSLLQRDINAIEALGVEFKTKAELGKGFALDNLEQDGYRAILLSLGLPSSRGLQIPGTEREDILLALPFLKAAKRGEAKIKRGAEVIVVGSGNVAMDVARCARRLGAGAVRIVCLERWEEIPAYPWEIEEALEEDIEIEYCGWGPKRFLEENGELVGLECKRCSAVFDAEGRFNPTYCEDELSVVQGDLTILAIGQAADVSSLVDMGVALNQRGQLIFDPNTLATSRAGVFACGEVISGPGMAVQAMASGRKAALSIAQYIEATPTTFESKSIVLGNLSDSTKDKIKHQERQKLPVLTPEQRIDNFHQIELGYSEELVIREARRCLSCGAGAEWLSEKCSFCLTCVRVCPYNVPLITTLGSIEIPGDQCQACGICYSECPAKAIGFKMPGVENLVSRMETALQEALSAKASPVILGLYCYFGVYAQTNLNELVKTRRPSTALVGVPCVGKVSTSHLLKAFELGADGVLIIGCPQDDCIYQQGESWIQLKMDAARKTLAEVGLDGNQLEMCCLSGPQPQEFSQSLAEFAEKIEGLMESNE